MLTPFRNPTSRRSGAPVDALCTRLAIALLFLLPLSKPAVNVLLVCLLLCLPFTNDAKRRFVALLTTPIFVGSAVLFVLLVLSALYADKPTALSGAWSYRTLILAPLVALALPTNRDRLSAWYAFIAGALLLFALSISAGLGLVPKVSGTAIGQFSFSKHAGQQGVIYLLAGVALIIFASRSARLMHSSILTIIGVALLLATALLIDGRTFWLSLGAVCVVLCVMRWRLWRGLLLATLALLGVFALAWLSPFAGTKVGKTVSDIDAAASGLVAQSWGVRAELLRIAPAVISTAPFFGHGMGSWNTQMRTVAPASMNPEIEHLVSPHQEFVFVAAEQGLVGLVIFVALLGLLARKLLRLSGDARALYLMLLTCYLTCAMVNTVLADFSHRHVFLLLLALLPVNQRSYCGDNDSDREPAGNPVVLG